MEMIGQLEREQRQIEQEIKCYMKNHELAFNDRYKVSWSNTATARLDTKRIREERPEVYQEYMKITTSRRFSVRAA